MEFLKDPRMEEMIQDIIDIFNLEGVELVRLSGISNRARRISGINDISNSAINGILNKMKDAGVISWKYIMKCPHCGEISYQIVERDHNKPKLCDTCNTIYKLSEDFNIEK